MRISRLAYYLRSIPTLLRGVREWPLVVAVFLGLPVRRPFTITLRPDGSRYRARTAMDVWIVKETCLDGDYERVGFRPADGWTVIDVGAGLGDFAVRAALGRPAAAVYAYEPFPDSYQLLAANVALNGLRNVRAYPTAVGAPDQPTLTLHAGAEAAVQHSTARAAAPAGPPGAADTAAAAGQTLVVLCTSLDAIFADHGLARCDLLKIDCEGGEYDILFHTSAATLARVRRVAMEYHDGVTQHSHLDLVRFFRAHGFAVKRRPNPAHANIGYLYAQQRGAPHGQRLAQRGG